MTDFVDNKEVWSAEFLPESPNIFYMNFHIFKWSSYLREQTLKN